MKTNFSIFISTGLFAISLGAYAQKDSSGIYQTAADFRNHKLSYAINYKTEKHKINDVLFLDATLVKVKHHDLSYTLNKSDIYGYKNINGQVFRFVNDAAYQILNPREELLLYLVKEPVYPLANPVDKYEAYYYFSKDAVSPPVALTIENLKRAYSGNKNFLASLDKYFTADEQLASY